MKILANHHHSPGNSAVNNPSPRVPQEALLLSLEHIHKCFHLGTKKEVTVLKDVSLDIPKSKVTVLLGPSGSGKSTLLRCMNLIAPFDQGSMTFMGQTW